MKKTLIALVAALAFGTAFHASAQSLKIGTVDVKKVFDSYSKTKDAEQRINEERNAARKELEDRMDSYKKLTDEVKKLQGDAQKPELSKEAKDARNKQCDGKIAELKAWEREIQEFEGTRRKQLEDQTVRMRDGIVEEIRKVIADLAKAGQFDLVIDKSGLSLNGVPNLLYSRDSYEFTGDVVTALNKKRSKDEATASAAPASSATAAIAPDAESSKPKKKP